MGGPAGSEEIPNELRIYPLVPITRTRPSRPVRYRLERDNLRPPSLLVSKLVNTRPPPAVTEPTGDGVSAAFMMNLLNGSPPRSFKSTRVSRRVFQAGNPFR